MFLRECHCYISFIFSFIFSRELPLLYKKYQDIVMAPRKQSVRKRKVLRSKSRSRSKAMSKAMSKPHKMVRSKKRVNRKSRRVVGGMNGAAPPVNAPAVNAQPAPAVNAVPVVPAGAAPAGAANAPPMNAAGASNTVPVNAAPKAAPKAVISGANSAPGKP
jgi:hypothetical protein